jgi:hypothetical protein
METYICPSETHDIHVRFRSNRAELQSWEEEEKEEEGQREAF